MKMNKKGFLPLIPIIIIGIILIFIIGVYLINVVVHTPPLYFKVSNQVDKAVYVCDAKVLNTCWFSWENKNQEIKNGNPSWVAVCKNREPKNVLLPPIQTITRDSGSSFETWQNFYFKKGEVYAHYEVKLLGFDYFFVWPFC